uniref:ABC-type Fe3+-hydroxamate transport system, periplasmic component n=1 Tax=Desulfovibrio sp. U5L TaxID=596152 RepID=I2Q3C8_9BACT
MPCLTAPSVRVLLALALAAACCLAPVAAPAATVTDMSGKTVVVPDTPRRVYALSPPDALLVYAVAPCRLAGWNYPQTSAARAWFAPCARDLPVLGGFFAMGMTPDKEELLKAAPDLAISGSMAKSNSDFDAFFAGAGIPVVHIESESPEDYPRALRLLGGLLGDKERGEALAAYADRTLADIRQGVASIPEDKRLTVYYAEGGDGLYTDGRGSFHTLVLELAGGVNVHPSPQTRVYGMDKVTLETVLGYAPQVILAQDAKCRDLILASPLWREIPAVRAGRVLNIPDLPLNWFDRPPSFMRLLGLKWMAHTLYPEVFPYDMVQETRDFFKLFWNRDVTEAEARTLLGQPDADKP